MCWVRLSSFILSATLAGCGLSHYQEQMAEQQARLERLDKENEYLDDPAQLREKQGRPPYFFRPPKGIYSIGTPHESSVLQRFPPRGNTSSYFQDVAFGVERMKAEDFWSSVLHLFAGKNRENARRVEKNTAGRGRVVFEELKSDDGKVFAYVWSQGDTHAAVLFRLALPNEKAALDLIDMSLGTLVVGPEATRMDRAYKAQKEHAKQQAIKRQKEAERE